MGEGASELLEEVVSKLAQQRDRERQKNAPSQPPQARSARHFGIHPLGCSTHHAVREYARSAAKPANNATAAVAKWTTL